MPHLMHGIGEPTAISRCDHPTTAYVTGVNELAFLSPHSPQFPDTLTTDGSAAIRTVEHPAAGRARTGPVSI